jgi:hypothetical protein
MNAGINLITLPLRVGTKAACIAARPVAAVGSWALELLLGALPSAAEEPVPSGPPPPPPPPPRAAPRPAPPPREPEPELERELELEREPELEPEPEAEPAHVSEEPELVAESADPEAVDSPTAELTVQEPWDGYRGAKADEVIALLPTMSREELAVVQLYESTHRARRSVLAAVERQLKIASPPR